ncbi:hypothetical protein [Actinomadura madurae]|uniref:hypothetical protein n=1 Tax=Actinomadura madurae TaxID=1993 RepID=UPI0020D24375|nr:hypothetical protein [Actinomadura madurae]MCP9978765.1 hypothetical protein [Actinomadura madurae]MCQ0009714.1 hypothetical protein [Actinomadura madurae]MCQ0014955.1 hypothetical protein [Actinomadura madurae]
MKIRTRARRPLLTATLAVASAMALAVSASAHAAPPPAPESQKLDDCIKALNVLSQFDLLPTQPDLSRTLCSTNEAELTEVHQTQVEQKQADQTRAEEIRAEQIRTELIRAGLNRPGQVRTERDPNTSYINEIEIEYTDKKGRTVETERPLGAIVEWPRNLIVKMPVLNEVTRTYIYRSDNG